MNNQIWEVISSLADSGASGQPEGSTDDTSSSSPEINKKLGTVWDLITTATSPGSTDATASRGGPMGLPMSDTIVDRLVEKYIFQNLPAVSLDTDKMDRRMNAAKSRPAFSVPIMSKNFRRLNTRTGIVFETVYYVEDVVSWTRPSETLSILIIYSFICLHPVFLFISPLLFLLFGIMIPAYVVRHPPTGSSLPGFAVPSQGSPLRDAHVPKPVPEISKEFVLNIVDTQNSMADFADLYDVSVEFLSSFAYFTDECRSSFFYSAILCSCGIIYISAPYVVQYLPWRLLFLLVGWTTLGANHPSIRDIPGRLHVVPDQWTNNAMAKINQVADTEFSWVETHEQREVEIFELQKFNFAESFWEPSIYVTDPYVFVRFNIQQAPTFGAMTLQDVLPPNEWAYITDSWKRDYTPELWVKSRCLSDLVEIDHSEKWAYDAPSDERIKFRRRRWVRLCSRKRR
jgi:hypothetical protein